MKEEFPGYFRLSPAAADSLWKKGIISLDANVLLDFYRYSSETRSDLLKLFEAFGERIWVAHQAAKEFLENRLAVISSQAKTYEDIRKQFEKIEQLFKASRGHPFLGEGMLKELSALFKKVSCDLEKRQKEFDALIRLDTVEERIVKLVEGKIGAPFSQEQLIQIRATGEKRYKDKIPPGYADDAKPAAGDKKYGDLLIWLQLLDHAKAKQLGVTFVTSDVKEDWWRTFTGRLIGPRPELVAEMRATAGVDLQMFPLGDFMRVAGEKSGTAVKPEAIKEVGDVAENRRQRLQQIKREMGELQARPGDLSNLRRGAVDNAELRAAELDPTAFTRPAAYRVPSNFGAEAYAAALRAHSTPADLAFRGRPREEIQQIIDTAAACIRSLGERYESGDLAAGDQAGDQPPAPSSGL